MWNRVKIHVRTEKDTNPTIYCVYMDCEFDKYQHFCDFLTKNYSFKSDQFKAT